jgi:hypothetical protein
MVWDICLGLSRLWFLGSGGVINWQSYYLGLIGVLTVYGIYLLIGSLALLCSWDKGMWKIQGMSGFDMSSQEFHLTSHDSILYYSI